MRNSGNLFSIDYNNPKLLKQNDQPFCTLDGDIHNYALFIRADEKRWAWCMPTSGVLHFSDGSAFADAFNARRVTINNKEEIVFLACSRKDNKLYVCRHPLSTVI